MTNFDDQLEAEIRTAQQDDIDASELWELFEETTPERQVIVFQRALEAGVLDDEIAFEMLETIRDNINDESPEDRAHYTSLLNQLRDREPELYQRSSKYYHRDLINYAITEDRWDEIPSLLSPYASGADLDIFSMVIAQLQYHGQIRPLIESMQTAWPTIKDAPNYFDWAIDEFAAKLMNLMLVEFIDNSPAPHPDDPQLKESAAFLLPWDEKWLDWFIRTVTQSEPSEWSPTDFSTAAGPEERTERINKLFVEFIAAQSQVGIPLSRGLMAWRKLAEIFQEQAKAFTTPQAKKKPLPPVLSRLLIPQSNRLDRILSKSFSMIGGEPYEVSAALELIPAYLQFIEGLGLIQSSDKQKALKKIKPLVGQLPRIVKYYDGDPVVIENLLNAWEMEKRS